MLHRLVVYGLLGIALVFSIQYTGYRAEEKWIEIVFQPQITQINPYQDEYEQMLYPVVRITTGLATGSGVIIESSIVKKFNSSKVTIEPLNPETFELYVLTAAHVVDNQSVVNVELYNSVIITGTVVMTDTSKDLALLCASAVKVYSAHLAPKDYTPYIFTPVYSVGCSLGLAPRPSQGIITAISHRKDAKDAEYWEVSSPILPGNSGGPVYDARTYEVIGIAVWVHTYQGQLITTMAGIVPINQIYEFLTEYERTKGLNDERTK
jgi:S1-C subfamily serine protease